MKNIHTIEFPNTTRDKIYSIDKKYHPSLVVDEIRLIYKNGEMAIVGWFEIIKDGKIIAEIKESVCNIYGEDVIDEKN